MSETYIFHLSFFIFYYQFSTFINMPAIIPIFLFGAIIGSLLSVIIPRLHDNIPGIIKGRSHCPECKTKLRVKDLIPLISYFLLKGKCASCSKTISWFYPVIEWSTALCFALSLPLFHNLNLNPITFDYQSLLFTTDFFLFIFWLFCLSLLLFIFFYDAKYYSIDDRIMIPGIILTLIIIALLPEQNLFPSLKSAIIGALIPFIFFGGQILLSKGRWLGSGDLRIGILMGLILGLEKILIALFLSYIIGSIFGIIIGLQKGTIKGIKIPFGPFLAIGTFLAFFFGEQIINWYLEIIF